MLGKVRSCEHLYSTKIQPRTSSHHSHVLNWKGTLSPGQTKASEAVIKAIEEQSALLIWAVCGAGKTEMLFHGLEHAFTKGYRVLLATPRTDVVKELTPRLTNVFPTVPIASYYGGSDAKDPSTPFIIATTHQVLRFYKAFDVIIVDEVDAFPYSYDKSLQYAVTEARKPNATMIYLSATPDKPLRQTPGLQTIKIAKRYHGHPLPVPTFRWCGHWRRKLQKSTLPQNVLDWLKQRQRKPVFLFAPSVALLTQISAALHKHSLPHQTVHATDPNRHTTVEAFRKGDIKLLVTTTILERGVTIANLDVAVLGAEDAVFTESALVQIAGRVGRSTDDPTGDVLFFHYGRTKAMLAAKRHIQQMNREGDE
ncbi:DEAD/DEAH box helicase [Halalkalibacter urbisdiaboli]|uniref:DEAD/DEAH box helicase n=1 Tax=Halalkalibacter urbisdiaboli TaxID=1960589 RepID=UPI001FD962DB|nr:DEAD/DEAH box helicase [Halalkalibacter urbisdiaboli]